MNAVLVLIIAISLYYFFFLYRINSGLKKLKARKGIINIPEEYISVIIPFRNESGNILQSLCSLEKQNYPKHKFEVIYVNDCSDDDSLEKLIRAQKSENIKVVSVPDEYSEAAHKKRAIKYALGFSKGDIIVSTDCDCVHSENWLKTMVSLYDNNTAFISGPVSFSNEDGSFEDGSFIKKLFSRLQSLEFAGLILTGAGLIETGNPVICNAANLTYKKDVYRRINGFEDNMNISSGDDEFLMQKIASDTHYKIKFNMDKDAVVFTKPNESFSQFFQQRKRWASKGMFYKDKMLIAKLIMIFLFYISLVFQLLIGLFYSEVFMISFLISLVLKMYIEYNVISKGDGILFRRNLLWYFIPAEIFQIPYIIVAAISGAAGNYTWKARKIKR